jgi:ABC-type sugar transport system ATPase subunit
MLGGSVVLRLRDISKAYPGVQAADHVDLELRAGTVHALVGENGAGKSTLLKIITGAERPTSGVVEVDGQEVQFHHPIAARRLGVVAVHQELSVLPALSAVANVFLGQERRRGRLMLSRTLMRRRFRELCEQLAVRIHPATLAGGLSIADQQSLEIMRALEANARILVLDEPTASLAVAERQALYRNIRRLQQRGVAILLISHDLDEVLELSDVISVMRDGQKVATGAKAEWTKDRIVRAMLGTAIRAVARSGRPEAASQAGELLRAENVCVPGRVRGVNLAVNGGEILGIAGLVGAGRTELLRALAGLEPGSSGTLFIRGRSVGWPKSPRAARRLGIGLAPEDRKSQGLVQTLPAFANVTLTAPRRATRGPLLVRARERQVACDAVRGLGLAEHRLGSLTSTLSGGNQQKVLLAKWVAIDLPILLVDEPTRGIDVGAKAEVFATLHQLADQGTAIVLVSSELEEVVDHSDRVLILARGRAVDELPGETATEGDVLQRIFDAEGNAS